MLKTICNSKVINDVRLTSIMQIQIMSLISEFQALEQTLEASTFVLRKMERSIGMY